MTSWDEPQSEFSSSYQDSTTEHLSIIKNVSTEASQHYQLNINYSPEKESVKLRFTPQNFSKNVEENNLGKNEMVSNYKTNLTLPQNIVKPDTLLYNTITTSFLPNPFVPGYTPNKNDKQENKCQIEDIGVSKLNSAVLNHAVGIDNFSDINESGDDKKQCLKDKYLIEHTHHKHRHSREHSKETTSNSKEHVKHRRRKKRSRKIYISGSNTQIDAPNSDIVPGLQSKDKDHVLDSKSSIIKKRHRKRKLCHPSLDTQLKEKGDEIVDNEQSKIVQHTEEEKPPLPVENKRKGLGFFFLKNKLPWPVYSKNRQQDTDQKSNINSATAADTNKSKIKESVITKASNIVHNFTKENRHKPIAKQILDAHDDAIKVIHPRQGRHKTVDDVNENKDIKESKHSTSDMYMQRKKRHRRRHDVSLSSLFNNEDKYEAKLETDGSQLKSKRSKNKKDSKNELPRVISTKIKHKDSRYKKVDAAVDTKARNPDYKKIDASADTRSNSFYNYRKVDVALDTSSRSFEHMKHRHKEATKEPDSSKYRHKTDKRSDPVEASTSKSHRKHSKNKDAIEKSWKNQENVEEPSDAKPKKRTKHRERLDNRIRLKEEEDGQKHRNRETEKTLKKIKRKLADSECLDYPKQSNSKHNVIMPILISDVFNKKHRSKNTSRQITTTFEVANKPSNTSKNEVRKKRKKRHSVSNESIHSKATKHLSKVAETIIEYDLQKKRTSKTKKHKPATDCQMSDKMKPSESIAHKSVHKKVTESDTLRQEISFSQLNLNPVTSFYTKALPHHTVNSNSIPPFSLFPRDRKQAKVKKKSKLDEKSVVSEAITKREKKQYVNGKRYQPKGFARSTSFYENKEKPKKLIKGVDLCVPDKKKNSTPNSVQVLQMSVFSVVNIEPDIQNVARTMNKTKEAPSKDESRLPVLKSRKTQGYATSSTASSERSGCIENKIKGILKTNKNVSNTNHCKTVEQKKRNFKNKTLENVPKTNLPQHKKKYDSRQLQHVLYVSSPQGKDLENELATGQEKVNAQLQNYTEHLQVRKKQLQSSPLSSRESSTDRKSIDTVSKPSSKLNNFKFKTRNSNSLINTKEKLSKCNTNKTQPACPSTSSNQSVTSRESNKCYPLKKQTAKINPINSGLQIPSILKKSKQSLKTKCRRDGSDSSAAKSNLSDDKDSKKISKMWHISTKPKIKANKILHVEECNGIVELRKPSERKKKPLSGSNEGYSSSSDSSETLLKIEGKKGKCNNNKMPIVLESNQLEKRCRNVLTSNKELFLRNSYLHTENFVSGEVTPLTKITEETSQESLMVDAKNKENSHYGEAGLTNMTRKQSVVGDENLKKLRNMTGENSETPLAKERIVNLLHGDIEDVQHDAPILYCNYELSDKPKSELKNKTHKPSIHIKSEETPRDETHFLENEEIANMKFKKVSTGTPPSKENELETTPMKERLEKYYNELKNCTIELDAEKLKSKCKKQLKSGASFFDDTPMFGSFDRNDMQHADDIMLKNESMHRQCSPSVGIEKEHGKLKQITNTYQVEGHNSSNEDIKGANTSSTPNAHKGEVKKRKFRQITKSLKKNIVDELEVANLLKQNKVIQLLMNNGGTKDNKELDAIIEKSVLKMQMLCSDGFTDTSETADGSDNLPCPENHSKNTKIGVCHYTPAESKRKDKQPAFEELYFDGEPSKSESNRKHVTESIGSDNTSDFNENLKYHHGNIDMHSKKGKNKDMLVTFSDESDFMYLESHLDQFLESTSDVTKHRATGRTIKQQPTTNTEPQRNTYKPVQAVYTVTTRNAMNKEMGKKNESLDVITNNTSNAVASSEVLGNENKDRRARSQSVSRIPRSVNLCGKKDTVKTNVKSYSSASKDINKSHQVLTTSVRSGTMLTKFLGGLGKRGSSNSTPMQSSYILSNDNKSSKTISTFEKRKQYGEFLRKKAKSKCGNNESLINDCIYCCPQEVLQVTTQDENPKQPVKKKVPPTRPPPSKFDKRYHQPTSFKLLNSPDRYGHETYYGMLGDHQASGVKFTPEVGKQYPTIPTIITPVQSNKKTKQHSDKHQKSENVYQSYPVVNHLNTTGTFANKSKSSVSCDNFSNYVSGNSVLPAFSVGMRAVYHSKSSSLLCKNGSDEMFCSAGEPKRLNYKRVVKALPNQKRSAFGKPTINMVDLPCVSSKLCSTIEQNRNKMKTNYYNLVNTSPYVFYNEIHYTQKKIKPQKSRIPRIVATPRTLKKNSLGAGISTSRLVTDPRSSRRTTLEPESTETKVISPRPVQKYSARADVYTKFTTEPNWSHTKATNPSSVKNSLRPKIATKFSTGGAGITARPVTEPSAKKNSLIPTKPTSAPAKSRTANLSLKKNSLRAETTKKPTTKCTNSSLADSKKKLLGVEIATQPITESAFAKNVEVELIDTCAQSKDETSENIVKKKPLIYRNLKRNLINSVKPADVPPVNNPCNTQSKDDTENSQNKSLTKPVKQSSHTDNQQSNIKEISGSKNSKKNVSNRRKSQQDAANGENKHRTSKSSSVQEKNGNTCKTNDVTETSPLKSSVDKSGSYTVYKFHKDFFLQPKSDSQECFKIFAYDKNLRLDHIQNNLPACMNNLNTNEFLDYENMEKLKLFSCDQRTFDHKQFFKNSFEKYYVPVKAISTDSKNSYEMEDNFFRKFFAREENILNSIMSSLKNSDEDPFSTIITFPVHVKVVNCPENKDELGNSPESHPNESSVLNYADTQEGTFDIEEHERSSLNWCLADTNSNQNQSNLDLDNSSTEKSKETAVKVKCQKDNEENGGETSKLDSKRNSLSEKTCCIEFPEQNDPYFCINNLWLGDKDANSADRAKQLNEFATPRKKLNPKLMKDDGTVTDQVSKQSKATELISNLNKKSMRNLLSECFPLGETLEKCTSTTKAENIPQSTINCKSVKAQKYKNNTPDCCTLENNEDRSGIKAELRKKLTQTLSGSFSDTQLKKAPQISLEVDATEKLLKPPYFSPNSPQQKQGFSKKLSLDGNNKTDRTVQCKVLSEELINILLDKSQNKVKQSRIKPIVNQETTLQCNVPSEELINILLDKSQNKVKQSRMKSIVKQETLTEKKINLSSQLKQVIKQQLSDAIQNESPELLTKNLIKEDNLSNLFTNVLSRSLDSILEKILLGSSEDLINPNKEISVSSKTFPSKSLKQFVTFKKSLMDDDTSQLSPLYGELSHSLPQISSEDSLNQKLQTSLKYAIIDRSKKFTELNTEKSKKQPKGALTKTMETLKHLFKKPSKAIHPETKGTPKTSLILKDQFPQTSQETLNSFWDESTDETALKKSTNSRTLLKQLLKIASKDQILDTKPANEAVQKALDASLLKELPQHLPKDIQKLVKEQPKLFEDLFSNLRNSILEQKLYHSLYKEFQQETPSKSLNKSDPKWLLFSEEDKTKKSSAENLTEKPPASKNQCCCPRLEESARPRREESVQTRREESVQPRRDESARPRRDESARPRRDESARSRRDESARPRRDESARPRRDESARSRRDESARPRREESVQPRREKSARPRREESVQPRREESAQPRFSDLLLKEMSKLPLDAILKLHSESADANDPEATFKSIVEELYKHKIIEEQSGRCNFMHPPNSVQPTLSTEHKHVTSPERKDKSETCKSKKEFLKNKIPHQEQSTQVDPDKIKKSNLESDKELTKPQKKLNSLTDSQIFERLLDKYDREEKELMNRQQTESQRTLQRGSLTDKEVFEKLLDKYEKEEKIVDKVCSDAEFIKNQIEDIIIRTTTKENVCETPECEGFSSKNKDCSGAEPQVRSSTTEDTQKVTFSQGQRFEEEKKILLDTDSLTQLLKKTDSLAKIGKKSSVDSTDSNFVRPSELGNCFLRGFRTDHVSLNGDVCLYLSKQEKERRMKPHLYKEAVIDFSERNSPLEYLLALGFSIDEASNAIKDDDVKNRLYAAITEARIWVNQINKVQGTLLYLVAYKAKPKTMRYFLQLVEAIINKRINNAVKLNSFLRLLEKLEDGELTMINILGSDKFEDEENEEKIVKKQLRQLFLDVYNIATQEAELKGTKVSDNATSLLRILAAKYRAGLHPHLQLIARYIGQGLICSEVQLEAAMIYLSRLNTADVDLKEFETYCAIKCKLDQNLAKK